MKRIKFDSILLFALVTPFIMGYRLSPGDTPYIWFGIIFVGLLAYIWLDVLKLSEKRYDLYKKILLWFLIIGVIGSAFTSAMIVRHKTHPIYMIHDIILQQEAAVQFLIHGKNPYATSYFGTFLEQWHYSDTDVNPALYYFVMEPFYLLFAIPFYIFGNHVFGFFDGRMPLLFLLFSLLVMAARLVKDQENKRIFLILLAFHPAMLGYTLEGRSDMFMLPFLFASLFLLQKRRYFLAGIPLALAFAIKQSAWFVFPFYVAYLYWQTKSLRKTVMAMLPFTAIFLAIVLPFFLWNPKAFMDSTVGYLSGNVPHSYPIAGYGLSMLLLQLGVIKDVHAYYPFTFWQIGIGMPVLGGLLWYLKQAPSIARLLFVHAVFLFIFWYLSRYFNNSHVAYISLLFIIAYFWPAEKNA